MGSRRCSGFPEGLWSGRSSGETLWSNHGDPDSRRSPARKGVGANAPQALQRTAELIPNQLKFSAPSTLHPWGEPAESRLGRPPFTASCVGWSTELAARSRSSERCYRHAVPELLLADPVVRLRGCLGVSASLDEFSCPPTRSMSSCSPGGAGNRTKVGAPMRQRIATTWHCLTMCAGAGEWHDG